MPVLSPFKVTTMREAVHGELVLFPDDLGGELAIKTGQDDYDYAFIAVLRSADTKSPHMSKVNNDAECLSYGVNWTFEIDRLHRLTRSQEVSEAAGSIHISRSGIFMRLAGEARYGFSGGWLDLSQNKPTRSPHDAYATNKWRLWADTKDRDNPRSEPLLVFPPSA